MPYPMNSPPPTCCISAATPYLNTEADRPRAETSGGRERRFTKGRTR